MTSHTDDAAPVPDAVPVEQMIGDDEETALLTGATGDIKASSEVDLVKATIFRYSGECALQDTTESDFFS